MDSNLNAPILELSNRLNGVYDHENFSWWNGVAYFPGEKHRIIYTINQKWKVTFLYENRISQYSKANITNLGTRADRHLYSFNCSSPLASSPIFRLSTYNRGLFNLFSAPKLFSLKTSNQPFRSWVEQSLLIKELYLKSKESSEFEPEIIGYMERNHYKISINYNTALFDINTIVLISKILNEILDFIDVKK